MSEMKELEMQLRSWAPRRPSAKLDHYLFREHAAAAIAVVEAPNCRQPAPDFRLSWLAPAMAALVLMCVLFNPRSSSTAAGSTSPGPMVALMMSNQSAAAFLADTSQNEQNTLRNTFERTNVSGYTPGVAPSK